MIRCDSLEIKGLISAGMESSVWCYITTTMACWRKSKRRKRLEDMRWTETDSSRQSYDEMRENVLTALTDKNYSISDVGVGV